jgi:SAM-dependent methyltransferase
VIAQVKSWIFESILRSSRFGQRRGWEWLTYHPGVIAFFHWSAVNQSPGVVSSLLETFPDAGSFADVGAGTGVYAARLQRRGRSVVACERSRLGRLMARVQGVRSVSFDLNEPQPAQLDAKVDVAYCFEVAEHLPPELGRRLVEFMLELAPTVVFSAAQPKQGGQGHINEQPLSYWAAEFERAGGEFDAATTTSLLERLDRSGTVIWIAANSQVFRRQDGDTPRHGGDTVSAG